MITLAKAVTVKLFTEEKEITTVNVVNVSINSKINKVLCQVENTEGVFKYSEVLTLWGGVKKADAPTPDPLEGTYFVDKDTSENGIEARVKNVIDKLYNK